MHRTNGIACLFLVALFCWTAILVSVSCADTVRLKNGRSIDGLEVIERGDKEPEPGGEVAEGEGSPNIPKGKIRINFSNGGWMLIDEKDVESIERNIKDAFKKGNDDESESRSKSEGHGDQGDGGGSA